MLLSNEQRTPFKISEINLIFAVVIDICVPWTVVEPEYHHKLFAASLRYNLLSVSLCYTFFTVPISVMNSSAYKCITAALPVYRM